MSSPNAEIDYIDADTGRVIATESYYDPGLDLESWYTKEQKARRIWRGLHMAYTCGRPIRR